jgi:2-C-methyl-D-erythritol 4-phosphate cytidylyltransferase
VTGPVRVAAVVPAAGRGERLGPGLPKALRELAGVPMLVHAVRALSQARRVSLVVVAAPPDGVSEVQALLDAHLVGPSAAEVVVVVGGETRQDSVRLALEALPADVSVVLVHDAARPLVPSELVDAVAAAVCSGAPAVVPCLPLADTVKRADPAGRVVETLQRHELRAIQTPQGFERDLLVRAHAAAAESLTDDAGLVEQLGVQVLLVAGHDEAFKVTRPLDLILAEAVLARRRAAGVR